MGGSDTESKHANDHSRHHFFTRSRKKKDTSEHIGRTSNIQTFFEAPDFKEADPKWVEHAPPTLPQAKKVKQEGAAVQIYKRRYSGTRREEFYIHKIVLQSPYLREALKDTLEKNGITFRDNTFAESIAPHHGLFFSLDQIAQASQTADDEITRTHADMLLTVVEEMFTDTLDELEKLDGEQKITFDLVWTLFPPGSVFGTQYYSNPPFALRVKRLEQNEERLKLVIDFVVFDGYRYGTLESIVRVQEFEGTVHVSSIPGLPYVNLSRNPEIKERLLKRGKKALDLQTIRYMTYKPQVKSSRRSDSPWVDEDEERRVVIDPHLYRLRRVLWDVEPLPGYQKLSNNDLEEIDIDQEACEDERHIEEARDTGRKTTSPMPGQRGARQKKVDMSKAGNEKNAKATWREDVRRPMAAQIERNRKVVLEDEDTLLLMHRYVSGFSLETRTWDTFYVEHLHPVEVDETVFDKVVLDPAKKDIIKTLVESHKDRVSHYDDLIRGKGECLLILLSGPPGTGKTLMAESLAEHLASPLLRADPAYIQQDMFQIMQGYDASLGQFLKDATEWGGLVLFDEPDFLFQTQEAGADRSELLAFLRHAEYFKGIIILTTNLGRSIDPAVISRAQIHIRFPALTRQMRVRVWENFIERLPQDIGTLSKADIEQLAGWQVNGREIKNILNMSVSWCRKKKSQLTVHAVENIIMTICSAAKKDTGNGIKDDDEDATSGEFSLLDM